MFYDKLIQLCNQKGVSVTRMCQEIGLATSAPVRWKRGSVPNMTTLFKIAEYFSIEPDPYEGKTITRPPHSFRSRCTSALLCG